MRLQIVCMLAALGSAVGQVPENLTVEGIPPITPELRAQVGRYLEFRTAAFLSWHPQKREMLIATRFAETPQLHVVKQPAGARRQLTFSGEPIRSGAWQPKLGKC